MRRKICRPVIATLATWQTARTAPSRTLLPSAAQLAQQGKGIAPPRFRANALMREEGVMSPSISQRWRVVLTKLFMVGMLVLLAASGAQAARATGTTYSGRATAVRASVLGVNTVLADTGALPSSGGAQNASLVHKSVSGLLTADVLHAATIAEGDRSRSESSLARLHLTVGGSTITANFAMARAQAVCTSNGPVVKGSAEVVNLSINGQTINVTKDPNQSINLPGGRVVLNEQKISGTGQNRSITVVGLRVVLDGVADVAIVRASAGITCAGEPTDAKQDFVTGGGCIAAPSCDRGSFNIAAGIKNGGLWGHLNYRDRGTDLKVKSTGITSYTVVNATTRRIKGTAEINGKGGFTFVIEVSDNGEPGKDNDTFKIKLSNGYYAEGKLNCGNIQLHKPGKCSCS